MLRKESASALFALVGLLCLASLSAAKETDHFHTLSSPASHDNRVELEPVTVFGVALPEWAVSVASSVVNIQRVPKGLPPPPPHDAPTIPRAPLHRPLAASASRRNAKRAPDSPQLEYAASRPGEWLVMVHKRFRDDFVSVLEDMGEHLNTRFGMRDWFDVPALREARSVHEQRRRDGKTDAAWRVDARNNEDGLQALEFDKRMMVKFTIPEGLRAREEDIIESLRDKEWAEFIEPNIVVRASTIQTQTLDSSATYYPWGIDRIDQRTLPLNSEYNYPSPTSNVLIYVVDTGILTTHEEFGGRASFGISYADDGTNEDCNGHGTHVSGIAVGTNVGVAKDVSVVAVKVLNCSGDGTANNVISGIDYAVRSCPSGTNCLISLSLGGDGTNSLIDAAVQSAYNSGLVVVSAAGNDAIDACNVSPARSPYGITVGATDTDDSRAYFSNYGSCVNVFAPGVDIPSSYYTSDTTYQFLSGTSQATPHVTGTAALYWGATNTGVGPSEVAGAIYASSTLNELTGTGSDSPNRMLYSLVDLNGVAQTAATGCTSSASCTVSSGTASSSSTAYVPSGQITVDSTSARYGYFQGWLNSSVDLDLELQFSSGSGWTTVATSSGSTGSEWIQYATSANGAGYYRWAVVASSGVSGTFTLSYQTPSSSQAGSSKNSGSALAPFWAPFYRAFF